VRARRAEQDKIASLKNRLIEFREEKIWKAFPDSKPTRCLLRDEMINEFIKCRPTNRDQWFRRISHGLRTGTESEQVGRFLDEVLGIIGEYT
jgi:hypothetical protein